MTVARIWQFAAENRTVADCQLYTGSAGPGISSTKAYTGTYSYRISTASPFGRVHTGITGVRLACYLNHAGYSTYENLPLAIFQVGAAAVRVVFDDQNNEIQAYLGYEYNSTTRYEPTTAVSAGELDTQATWHHLGINYYCHASAGYLSVYVNGVQAYTYSGDTTIYAALQTSKEAASVTGSYGPGSILSGTLLGLWANYLYVDDLYIDEYSGGEPDIAPTSRRFLPALVTGDSGTPGWTPEGAANNYDCVDDGAPDDNTTYVLANAADLVDYYTFGDITVPAGYTIRAAIVQAYCQRTDTGTNSLLRVKAKNGGDVSSSADLTPGGAYSVVFGRFENAPDSSSWSESDFNDSVFGIESRGTF